MMIILIWTIRTTVEIYDPAITYVPALHSADMLSSIEVCSDPVPRMKSQRGVIIDVHLILILKDYQIAMGGLFMWRSCLIMFLSDCVVTPRAGSYRE